MKDGLMLLLTAVVCAAGAALFFRIFGSDALNIIVLLTLVGTIGDNFRLRRRLREMGAKPEGKRTWL
ncbi:MULTISPECIES: hypothetical protein [unclassified Duganella]|jgi:hypothetical protein|uniref:hypothetical protein n=1 Tax=unclassified Duganella TaxID=2636909 RepID=UPI0008816A84|nr:MULTISPECIES: hypothetical protein [unclassified Duganella]SDG13806.1 hypothetical protein SAMN05216320_10318 [Duganella sp. OV458]SDJ34341.1 hypothetical protein SAMN05428973_103470 [Duganella sp. OV510]